MGRRGRRGGRGGAAGGVFGKMSGSLFRSPPGRRSSTGTPSAPAPTRTPAGGRPGPRGGPRRDTSPQSQSRPTDRTCKGGDPVGIVTGEVILTETDLALPGVLALVLSRTHISAYRSGRLFGPSWASTLDTALELDGQGVHFLAPDASVRTYPQTLIPNVEFMPAAGPRHPLMLTSEGGYRLADPHTGITWHFPAPGPETGWSRLPLVAITDRYGNRVEFLYEDQAITEVRHSGGYRVIVDTVAVEEGDRRVTALRTPGGTVLRRFAHDPVTGDLTEAYDSAGVPVRYTYDDHRLTGWTDRNGHRYRYVYDENGRAVRGEGSEGRLNSAFHYDPDNRVTRLTDSLGNTTVYRYNEYDQVVEETDPLGGVVRSEWDQFDRLLSQTDPLGHTTRFSYDDRGNIVQIRYPDGLTASAEYNELDLPVRIVQPDGSVWVQEYDERGALVRRTDPAGRTTVIAYGPNGAPTAVTDPLGHTTRIESDPAGLAVRVTDARGRVVRTEFDELGRPVASTDPVGGVTRLTWDAESRLTSRTLPDGTTDRWRHDAEGNEIERIDPLGRTTRTAYGPFNLPSLLTRPDGSTLAFAYDTELRLTSVTTGDSRSWTYTYDGAGNLTGESDFNGRTLRYGHDAAGRLISRSNGAGETVTFARDGLGRLIRRDAAGRVATFAYDPLGRLTEAANPDATVKRAYDIAGNLLSETVNGAAVLYTYDPLGRVLSRTTPNGVVSQWTYDPVGLPTALSTGGRTIAFDHDEAGREVARRVGPNVALAQRWDTLHRLTSQTLWGAPDSPGGQARLLQHRSYAYRADGDLAGITDRLAGDRRYDLDARGRIIAVRARGWEERYAYDEAGNLVQADHPSPAAETGTREIAGTLVRRAGRTRYEHDAQGRVILRERVTLSGRRDRWRFHWDAEDRLIGTETPDGARWRYHYDALGRRTAKQRLGADGGPPAEVYLFTWDDVRLVEQTRTANGTSSVTSWEYLPRSHAPLAQSRVARTVDRPQEWFDHRFEMIVTDLAGAPAELVAADGTTTAMPPTTAWGAPLAGTADAPCPLRLAGQYHDAETGLSYNFQRYYNPETGAYCSPDPLGLAPQPNPHTYVRNPTTWTDPLGLSPAQGCGTGGNQNQPYIPSPATRRGAPGGRAPVYQDVPVAGNWTPQGQANAATGALPEFATSSRTARTASRTYVGAVDTQTGRTVLASSGNGYCAEGNAINRLGIPAERVLFTQAVTVVKNDNGDLTTVTKPVCQGCQIDFPDRGNFVPGTRGAPGGWWGDT